MLLFSQTLFQSKSAILMSNMYIEMKMCLMVPPDSLTLKTWSKTPESSSYVL